MHDSNPFRKDTTDLQEEQILLEERLNFANDICEAVGLEPEELLEMMLDLVEAVEQLDELSPKTLASYAKKNLATVKRTDLGGEYIVPPRKRKVEFNSPSDATRDLNRTIGMQRAIDKLAEAVEQLDELSPERYASYIPKAHDSGIDASDMASHTLNSAHHMSAPAGAWLHSSRKNRPKNVTDSDWEKIQQFHRSILRGRNRTKGIDRATHALVKAANKK